MKEPSPPSRDEVLQLAIDSSTDPRTVEKYLLGEPVRGITGDRIRRAIEKRGSTVTREAVRK